MIRHTRLSQRPQWFELNAASPLANGLVFAGLGGNPGSFFYRDSSPYRNNGRLTNMDPATDWVWVPELGRWALDFDGLDDYVPFPTINLGTNYTGTAWFKKKNASRREMLISTSTSNYGTCMAQLSDTNQLYTSDDNEELMVSWIADTNWHYMAVARNNTNVRFYIDGTQVGSTQTFSTNGSIAPDQIARYWSGLNQIFSGLLSDVGIYNRPLSPSEISALADPSNAMLEVGNTPLILPPRRRLWPVAAAEESSSSSSPSSSSSVGLSSSSSSSLSSPSSVSSVGFSSSSSSSSSSPSSVSSFSSSSSSSSSSSESSYSSSSSVAERGVFDLVEVETYTNGALAAEVYSPGAVAMEVYGAGITAALAV